MKQITEDYVSYEIAKLLKEKGFNERCGTAYTTAEGYPIRVMGSTYSLETNSDYDNFHYSMPSQSLALKWLREEHLYHIFAKPVQLKNRVDWRARIVAEDCDTLPITIHGESPEQAVEAALLYVLKNLI